MVEAKDLCFAYLDAYIYAKQTKWLIHGKIQGTILDTIKETAVKCMEDYVEQLNLSVSNMEEIKHNHEQWADLALERGARNDCVWVVIWKNKLEIQQADCPQLIL